jgi:hypothetical protein
VIELVFELGPKACLPRLVVINLVIDLRDCEPMESELQRLARAARRR